MKKITLALASALRIISLIFSAISIFSILAKYLRILDGYVTETRYLKNQPGCIVDPDVIRYIDYLFDASVLFGSLLLAVSLTLLMNRLNGVQIKW